MSTVNRQPLLPNYSSIFGYALVEKPLQVGKVELELVNAAKSLYNCVFSDCELRTADYGLRTAECHGECHEECHGNV